MAMNLTSSAALYERFKPAERLVLLFEAMARGDDAEVERVHRTCPRKTYTGPDMAFDDRYEMTLDVTAVCCGELKAQAAQLRLIRWATRWTRHGFTSHTINSTMAFLDGVRHGRGLPQTPFFKLGLRDRVRRERARKAGTLIEDDDGGDGDGDELGDLPEEFYRRMAAVERRSERFTRPITWGLRRAEMDLAAEFKNNWAAYDAFCTSRVGLPAARVLEACQYPGRVEFAEVLERYKDVAADEKTVTAYREGLCGFWDRRFGTGA